MEQTDKTPYIIGGIATLLACLLCCFTASFMLYKELLINSYVQAEATVVDHDYITTTDDGGTYYDVIEFTVDGRTYTKVALNNGADFREPQNFGEKIVIYYNPDNPDDVLYKVDSHIFMLITCYVVAVGCAVGATVLFIKYFKISKREREYKSRLYLWKDD